MKQLPLISKWRCNYSILTCHLQQPVCKCTLAMIHVSHYAKVPDILS